MVKAIHARVEVTMKTLAANDDRLEKAEKLASEMRITFEVDELSAFFSGFEPLDTPMLEWPEE